MFFTLAYKPKQTKGVTQMNILKTLTIVVISMVFIAGLPACEKKNSAEAVGEKIDETAEKTGDILNEKIIDYEILTSFHRLSGEQY